MPPPQMTMSSGGLPRAGKAIIGLIAANVVFYVLEVILIRAQTPVIELLFMTPADVFERGFVWQPVTYVLLHSPTSAGHLIMNMVMLWMFGAQLEQWWGSRRVLIAYAVCALSGAAFTLLVAALSLTPVLSWLLPDFWGRAHVGASGAVLGLTIAWGTVFAKQEMQFLFLGRMTGRTFMLIIVAIELLVALSLDSTSSTSHFGGMIGGYLLVSGKWRPSKWKSAPDDRRSRLDVERRRIERELRIIEGGKGKGGGGGSDLPN